MKQHSVFVLIFFLAVFFSAGSLALADTQAFKEGERLSRTCASCHGTNGASPGQLIPIIGGQLEAYLKTAMQGFAEDQRPGSVMLKLAKGYGATEQQQIASFFAAQTWVNTPHAAKLSSDATLVKSCQGCHGGDGNGRGMFPRLAGQHPEYLLEALLEYQKGERKAATMALVKGIDAAALKTMADHYSAMK